MTTEVREKFEKIKNELTELVETYEDLNDRYSQAEKNIVDLQDEKVKIRENRPQMIADNEDVSKISNRLKDIDAEIELNKDAIKGIGQKRYDMSSTIKNITSLTNSAFKKVVEEELQKLSKKYLKAGNVFAQIVRDYVVLEIIGKSGDKFYRTLGDSMPKISNPYDYEHPLFEYKYYDLYKEFAKEIREKYALPDYIPQYPY